MTRYDQFDDKKTNGVVYTPHGMALDLSSTMIRESSINNSQIRILDPALGGGSLISALLQSLPDASKAEVWAYELDGLVLSETETSLKAQFPKTTFHFIEGDLIDLFLSGHLMGREFDFIIANPPYLRTQIMGEAKAKMLAKAFGLTGRVDAYYAFLMIAIELLSDRGIAGFITSNRFMSVKSGLMLREYLMTNTEMIEVIDFGDTKLFGAAVLPCTLVFRRGSTNPESVNFWSIYQKREVDRSGTWEDRDFPYREFRAKNEIIHQGFCFAVSHGSMRVSAPENTWSVADESSTSWLQTVDNNTYMRLNELGKIRVGIKTTADKVFILKTPDSFGDDLPELSRPLLTHRNAGQIVGNSKQAWKVVYPHEVVAGRRRVCELDDYPKTKTYLLKHYEQLSGRKYVQKAKRKWYEVWVPQNPARWSSPKIVFRDIAETPQFWLDRSGAVVNGDLYWIDTNPEVKESLLYLALGVLNSSFITKYYDARVNNKLYAGKRRFMTQYVEQFPLPDPNSDSASQIIHIVENVCSTEQGLSEVDRSRLDELVEGAFSLVKE